MEWSRRVKGITSEMKYQASKPSGEPGKSSFPLEYFTLKEWLVAGPFACIASARRKQFLDSVPLHQATMNMQPSQIEQNLSCTEAPPKSRKRP
jgi:hypothetical protein